MRGRGRSAERGFTMIELMVVVAVLLMLAAIAIPSIRNARAKRIRSDATNALGSLRGFEEFWFERTGAYTYSSNTTTDKITWATVTNDKCTGPTRSTTFQTYVHDNVFKDPGNCTWDYFVIDDLCEANCALTGAGSAAKGTGRLFCAIAVARSSWTNGGPLPTKGESFCLDKIGHQYSSKGYPGWP